MTASEIEGIVEVLTPHADAPRKTLIDDDAEGWGWYCGCGARVAENVKPDEAHLAHRRHVAEVIAASGVVVPAAEVKALAARIEAMQEGRHVDVESAAECPGCGALEIVRDLRALLARLAGR